MQVRSTSDAKQKTEDHLHLVEFSEFSEFWLQSEIFMLSKSPKTYEEKDTIVGIVREWCLR